MSNRIRFLGYHISRYPVNIARYTMLTHAKNKPNPKRYEKLTNGLKRYETDGLNSIKYSVLDAQRLPLYTWLLVQLNPEVNVMLSHHFLHKLIGIVPGKLIKGDSHAREFIFVKVSFLLLLSIFIVCIFKFILF